GLGFVLGVEWLHLHVLPEGGMAQNALYTLGLFALLATLLTMLYSLFLKKISAPEIFLGGAILLFAGALVTSKWMAGGSYLFVWPLLASLLAAIASFRPGKLRLLPALLLCALSLP